MNTETTQNIPKAQLLNVFNQAFHEVENSIEKSSGSALDIQNNLGSKSATVPIQTGIQNLLITLLLELARKLGLGEDELEKVFDEVLKLMSTYKAKKGET